MVRAKIQRDKPSILSSPPHYTTPQNAIKDELVLIYEVVLRVVTKVRPTPPADESHLDPGSAATTV